MVNVITQLFKYMVALIMAIYTIRCFTVFSLDSSHALYDYFSE